MKPEEHHPPVERPENAVPDTPAAAVPQTMMWTSQPAGEPPKSAPEPVRAKGAAGVDAYATQAFAASAPEAGLRYRPVRPHARGGLGEVLVAHDEELNREVALKQIQDRFADDEVSRGRFVLEAEITGGLEHPGIVPVYGLGTYRDGRPYYAMRFIRGMSLSDAVDEFHGAGAKLDAGQRALEFRKLLARLVTVCQALEYAHSRGVIHRDIKPGNIMLGKFGETLVVDWGLAKLVGRPETHRTLDEQPLASQSIATSMPTMMGTALGTPQFMSPEQALGRLDLIDATSDVYSLGATLYYVLTGQSPFTAGDVSGILQKVQRGQFPPPRSINKTVSAALEAICLKAMAREHTERYPSAGALADDLEHWLADEPVAALPDSLPRRVARWARHHRAWALSGVAALCLVTVASTVAMFFVEGERRRADQSATAAIHAKSKEEEARRHAERQARIADASRLASQSNEALRSLPQLSLLLAVESLQTLSDHDEPPLAESRQALCDALAVVGGQPLVGHQAPLQTIALSHDGRWAASGDEDGAVCLWDLDRRSAAPKPLVLSGHKEPVWAIAFSRDGRWLATAGGDHEARLWNMAAQKPAAESRVLAGHSASINALAFAADSRFLATVSKDKTARLWELSADSPSEAAVVLKGHTGDVDVLAFGDDGRWLATGGGDETVRLWNLAAGNPAASPQVLPAGDAVLAVAISPDSQWLAAGAADGAAHVWQLTADDIAESAATLTGHDDAINSLAISSNSRRLFSGSYDGTIRIWSLGGATATSSQTLRGHDGGIFSLAVSANGRWLASGGADKTARLWDLEAADPAADAIVMRGHDRTLLALALREDGRHLVTAARDTAPRVWDFSRHDGAALPLILRGPTRTVLDLQVSGDGRWLAAASADRTTSLWDIGSGDSPAERLVLGGHGGGVWRAAFDPTGRWLATVSHDATARLWDLEPIQKASSNRDAIVG
ncbi:MAG TPA: protein kinase, partial [Pirellulales bacterium]